MIAVAPILEPPENWQTRLSPTYALPDWERLTNAKRLREWVNARLLLQQLQPKARIIYDTYGKPLLQNSNKSISITHTAHHVGIILSSEPNVGIDMEPIGWRVLRIKHKFLSVAELRALPDDDPFLHTLYWSAKESLYKYYGKKGLQFNRHLRILQHYANASNPPRSGRLNCQIAKNGFQCKPCVQYQQIENSVLTYV